MHLSLRPGLDATAVLLDRERSHTMSTASAPAQPTRRQSVLSRHPLASYFLITFAFSWLLYLPALFTFYGVLSLIPQIVGLLAIAGLLGPILSGFVMTSVSEGRPGMVRLLRRIVLWRVGLRWYLFALVGVPVVMVFGTIIRPGVLG